MFKQKQSKNNLQSNLIKQIGNPELVKPLKHITCFFSSKMRLYIPFNYPLILTKSQVSILKHRYKIQYQSSKAGFGIFGYKNPIYRMKAGRSAYWTNRELENGEDFVESEATENRTRLLLELFKLRNILITLEEESSHLELKSELTKIKHLLPQLLFEYKNDSNVKTDAEKWLKQLEEAQNELLSEIEYHKILTHCDELEECIKWLNKYVVSFEKDEKLFTRRNWITQFRLRTMSGNWGWLKYTRYMRYDFGYRHKVFFRLPLTVRTWRWMVSRRLCWASKNIIDARSLYVRVLTVRKTLLPYKIKGYQMPLIRRYIYRNILYRTGKRLPGRGR